MHTITINNSKCPLFFTVTLLLTQFLRRFSIQCQHSTWIANSQYRTYSNDVIIKLGSDDHMKILFSKYLLITIIYVIRQTNIKFAFRKNKLSLTLAVVNITILGLYESFVRIWCIIFSNSYRYFIVFFNQCTRNCSTLIQK